MKMNFFKICSLVAFVCIFSSVSASLPELKVEGPSTLPFTVTNSPGQCYIDVDRNGLVDFTITHVQDCDNLTNPSSSYTEKFKLAPYGTGTSYIMSEIEVPQVTAPNAIVAPTEVGYYFTSLLTSGVSIQATPIAGSTWYSSEAIVSRRLIPYSPNPAPTSSHFNGVDEGYIGVSFYNGGTHYGWIHVRINDGGESVDVLSTGFQSAVGSPVVAGANDPYATTPIPLIATILGFGLIGGGAFLRKRFKK